MSPFLSALFAKLLPASVVGKVAAVAVAVAAVTGGGVATLEATSSPVTTTVGDETTLPAPDETAAEPTGDETTAPVPSDDEADVAPVEEPVVAEPVPDVPEVEAPEESAHPDNHGAAVSEAAHESYESGREHGQAVSEVARGGHGAQDGDDDGGPGNSGAHGHH
jgi:hypothetical protein